MKHQKHKNTADPRSSLVTALIALASVVLIALIIYLSPLGNLVQAHVIKPILTFFSGENRDSDIIDALKVHDAQSATPVITAPATAAPLQKCVLTVKETQYFVLQMGVFLEKSAADEHAAQLHQMGAGGVVLQDGQVFRVFVAAYTDENSLMQVQSQVRADGFEATPYITEHNTVQITLEGSDAAITEARTAISLLSSVPSDLNDLSLRFDQEEIDTVQVFQALSEMKRKTEEIRNVFEGGDAETMLPILSIIEKYENAISTFLQERDTITENELSADLKRLQLTIIIDYIRFFDQK